MELRIAILIIIVGVTNVFATPSYSQLTKVSLDMKNTTLEKVMDEIEHQTEFYFIFNQKQIDVNRIVSIETDQKLITDILPILFNGTNVNYAIIDRKILLTTDPINDNLITEALNADQLQQRIIGKVTDEKGNPLPGVTVLIKGTTLGALTDISGQYILNNVPKKSTLIFSFVGMTTQEIPVNESVLINVVMKEAAVGLEEVVVVGYGTQKKVDMTGVVAVVKGDDLKNRPTTTASQALQGKVTGMNFTAGSNGFEPGSSLSLQIRGQGSPLILIDGVPGTLDRLNPNDIESTSILKDAAACAIYGAQATYGVVLITTKSGSQNGKINVEYSHSNSETRLVREPHMPNSYTNALALNEACANTGTAGLFTNETIDRIIAYQKDPSLPQTVPSAANPLVWAVNNESNADFDWFKVYYGQGARNQDNISISGGTKQFSYYLAAGQQYDKGELKIANDEYQRYNTLAKFDLNPLPWLSFTSNSRFTKATRTRPGCTEEGGYSGLFWYIARDYPNQYMIDPNGHTSRISWIPFVRDGGVETMPTNDFLQRFSTQVTPLKGWTINADYSFNIINSIDNLVSNTVYDYGVQNQPIVMSQSVPNYMNQSQTLYFYNTLNAYSTYKFKVGNKNNFSILAGYQQEKSTNNYLYGTRNNLIDQDIPSLNLATGVQQTTGNLTYYATQGVFSRLNYDYDNRYLIEFNSRYDGTYKFAANKRWGFFPSISGGWNMSNEKFWEPIQYIVNQAKIRASYGTLGNQRTATAYQDLPLMGVSSNLAWIINGARPAYVTAPNLVNPDITWESSATQDLGIDLGFLKNKITFTGDIYKRYTFNQLGPSNAVPAVIGVSVLPNSNNMETTTKGWEASLTWNDHIGSDFNFSLTGLLFDNVTKITKYNNPTGILTNPYPGQTVGDIWGFVTTGLIQTQDVADNINNNHIQTAISGIPYKTGDCQYTDLNGDGLITYGKNTVTDPGDQKVIGNSTPRYQFGINLKAEWKGIDLTMFWQGTLKRDLMLNGNLMWGFQATYANTLTPATLNYYRDVPASQYNGLGLNLNAYYPRPYNDQNMNNKNQITQTRYLQNAAYARLKNIQIGYTIPKNLSEKIKLEDVYLYVSAENLMTITRLLANFDPETANIGFNGTSGYSYPASGVVTVGLNVKF